MQLKIYVSMTSTPKTLRLTVGGEAFWEISTVSRDRVWPEIVGDEGTVGTDVGFCAAN